MPKIYRNRSGKVKEISNADSKIRKNKILE